MPSSKQETTRERKANLQKKITGHWKIALLTPAKDLSGYPLFLVLFTCLGFGTLTPFLFLINEFGSFPANTKKNLQKWKCAGRSQVVFGILWRPWVSTIKSFLLEIYIMHYLMNRLHISGFGIDILDLQILFYPLLIFFYFCDIFIWLIFHFVGCWNVLPRMNYEHRCHSSVFGFAPLLVMISVFLCVVKKRYCSAQRNVSSMMLLAHIMISRKCWMVGNFFF